MGVAALHIVARQRDMRAFQVKVRDAECSLIYSSYSNVYSTNYKFCCRRFLIMGGKAVLRRC